jgi:hypothetical protein
VLIAGIGFYVQGGSDPDVFGLTVAPILDSPGPFLIYQKLRQMLLKIKRFHVANNSSEGLISVKSDQIIRPVDANQ